MASATTEMREFKRGPGGRPTRAEAERRHHALLSIATRLFLERGYDATSVEEIAKQAGVAKRFIYARYDDKSELFVAAIEHSVADRLEVLHAFTPPRGRVELGLTQFARTLVGMATQPDVLALRRLFITAAPRFPDLAKLFVERNRRRSLGDVERVLKFYGDRGEIRIRNLQMMAEHFFILNVGIPQQLALLGMRESPQQEQRRLRESVRLFLDGCRDEDRGNI
jgi:TetR/AcrR family transcriptional regulator, mexJK operon transcriptional repressor